MAPFFILGLELREGGAKVRDGEGLMVPFFILGFGWQERGGFCM